MYVPPAGTRAPMAGKPRPTVVPRKYHRNGLAPMPPPDRPSSHSLSGTRCWVSWSTHTAWLSTSSLPDEHAASDGASSAVMPRTTTVDLR